MATCGTTSNCAYTGSRVHSYAAMNIEKLMGTGQNSHESGHPSSGWGGSEPIHTITLLF